MKAQRVVVTVASVLPLFHIVAGFTTQKGPSSSSSSTFLLARRSSRLLFAASSSENNSYGDFDGSEDDDDDDDDYIDTDNLGDWRTFRMNLAETGSGSSSSSGTSSSMGQKKPRKSVSKENEEVLRSQSAPLAEEYESGIWAHEAPKPEVGGLIVRLPLEVELYRNTKHSRLGKKLRQTVSETDRIALWYRKAQLMCQEEMKKIAKLAENGQIDGNRLDEESNEYLQLYLDNQETWQEVCLVVDQDEDSGKACAFVLNRPMAFKLTENLAQLVLNGSFKSANPLTTTTSSSLSSSRPSMDAFLRAFGKECAVYVGGPDDQGSPAVVLHGYRDIPGATEISPGSNIFRGGLTGAVEGILDGTYKALDFRFFVGKHSFEDNTLELECLLGKYQPVACARPLALKQCISLPKPLYHEVLELCGGELKMISQLEMQKRDDLNIQLEMEDDDDDDIFDELDELSAFDEDDDDDDFAI